MSNNYNDREVVLSIKHVDISFDTGGKKKFVAVKDANFDIYKGETFALVGESGSGKTTLGRAIMRINPCSAGEILFEGRRISGKISKEEDRNVVRNIQMIVLVQIIVTVFEHTAAKSILLIHQTGLYDRQHYYNDQKQYKHHTDRLLS